MNPLRWFHNRIDLAIIRLAIRQHFKEHIMPVLDNINASIVALQTAMAAESALTDKLAADIAAMKAGTPTPEELAATQASIDALTEAAKATVARDTPA